MGDLDLRGKLYLQKMVLRAEEIGSSDIHVTADRAVSYRCNGQLSRDESFILSDVDVRSIYHSLGLEQSLMETKGSADVSTTVSNSRLRIHFYTMVDGWAISIRLIPQNIPKFEDLYLPEVIKSFTSLKNGLVLVTGTTGSGKTTTLASLIEYINQTSKKKVITVEDPIEFIYEDNQSLIIQRELGMNVETFDEAIAQAVREDPDILLVGELRDLDTIQSALRMAETGHLVFGTLHTRGAAATFNRLIDIFPPNQQDQIRYQLSSVIQGVVSQQLIKVTDKNTKQVKRLPLCEVLVPNAGIRGMIASKASLTSLQDNIQANHQKNQSQTFIQSAASLINKGLLSVEEIRDIFTEEEMKKLRTSMIGRNR